LIRSPCPFVGNGVCFAHRWRDKERKKIFHVTLEHAEDGWIVVECPALPGCVSQGQDEKDAIENVKEAITAWLWAEKHKQGDKL